DVDCGGNACPKCANGKHCTAGVDCQSNVCTEMTCVAPPASCSDGTKNGSESDTDCGGGNCPRCINGKKCNVNSDCQSNNCSGGFCAVPQATCNDGIQNGN